MSREHGLVRMSDQQEVVGNHLDQVSSLGDADTVDHLDEFLEVARRVSEQGIIAHKSGTSTRKDSHWALPLLPELKRTFGFAVANLQQKLVEPWSIRHKDLVEFLKVVTRVWCHTDQFPEEVGTLTQPLLHQLLALERKDTQSKARNDIVRIFEFLGKLALPVLPVLQTVLAGTKAESNAASQEFRKRLMRTIAAIQGATPSSDLSTTGEDEVEVEYEQDQQHLKTDSPPSGSTEPTAVELQKLILQKIVMLERGQEEIKKIINHEIEVLRKQNQMLLQQVASSPPTTATQTPKEVLQGLTPKQEEVLKAIDALQGDDKTNREQATELLSQIRGDAVTKAMVLGLRDRLKSGAWGIKCTTCGCASRIVWNQNAAYSTGGSLQFAHALESGGTTKHSGHTTFPSLKIMSRIVHSGNKPITR